MENKYIPSVLAKATPMMDEYDPVQRIMTKALNLGEIEWNEGRILHKFLL